MVVDSFSVVPTTPTKVGPVEIILRVEAGAPNTYTGRYSFDQLNAANVVVNVRQGDLVPHLTPAQITSIKAFLDAMLTKAQASI